MISSSPSRQRRRAPRARLHGTVSANIQLPNRRKIPSKLQLLSITGGLLEVSTFVDERTKVVLAIPFASGTAYPKAEMLFPMRAATGYLQPFRFTNMKGEDLLLIDREITEVLRQSLASPHRLGASRLHPSRFNPEHF